MKTTSSRDCFEHLTDLQQNLYYVLSFMFMF